MSITKYFQEKLNKKIEYKYFEKMIDKKMQQIFLKIFNNINSETSTCTTTSTADINDTLTLDKLKEMQKSLNQNPYFITPFEIAHEKEPSDIWKYMHSYGTSITRPKKTYKYEVQKRTHRSKRINKKWLKRYGMKEITKLIDDSYGIISLSSC